MAKQKFITSHASRIKRAKKVVEDSPEDYSRRDLKAIRKFLLLEDVVRLYEYRLETEEKKRVETRAGKMAKERNIAQFSAILTVFRSAIEIAWAEITAGNCLLVGRTIPERSLKVTANRVKYLPKLRGIAVDLLRTLSDDALMAGKEAVSFDEDLDALESHEENVRRVEGLPSPAEIEEIIAAAENLIPDAKREGKARPNLNAN